MTYDIKPYKEHFVVYINGEFYCTADKRTEAEEDVENYFKGGNANENKSAC
jgi:hypothetical protein